jgi:hypothetical protein
MTVKELEQLVDEYAWCIKEESGVPSRISGRLEDSLTDCPTLAGIVGDYLGRLKAKDTLIEVSHDGFFLGLAERLSDGKWEVHEAPIESGPWVLVDSVGEAIEVLLGTRRAEQAPDGDAP